MERPLERICEMMKAYKISDNIISPLGFSTEENYQSIKAGNTSLHSYTDKWGLREPVEASLFDDSQNEALSQNGLSRFESMVLLSVKTALQGVDIDITDSRTVFILSTTKGNVELLDTVDYATMKEHETPGDSAARVAAILGITTAPIVVCNACISGVSALILAMRLLNGGQYDNAIVCGADSQSKFIVSGFQSFKALSTEPCRPFDMERNGLNLGEAAATMVLSVNQKDGAGEWSVTDGVCRNDAYHISSPSKTGEGCFKALEYVLKDKDINEIANINVHGTATMYNDQMESMALKRADILHTPVNAYKGYLGHTMGAAGILETIITMRALDDHLVLGTKGFSELGVSGRIAVSAESKSTENASFVKLISGFGGCNAAIYVTQNCTESERGECGEAVARITHTVKITNDEVVVDGTPLHVDGTGKELLTHLYKSHVKDCPKYFKMDMLSKLGFIASELLLQAEGHERFEENTDRAVILFNRTSSLIADSHYHDSIKDKENFYPSPAAFVYTLPNIVTGEIAIRNNYHGETTFYILPHRCEATMRQVTDVTLCDKDMKSVLGGWLDCEDEQHFTAELYITEKE